MTYCPLPFKHVFIEPRGVRPCCSYTAVADLTVEQWLNSAELKELQNNIVSGRVDPGCQDCINNEKLYANGTRAQALKEYGTIKIKTTQIDYVDYRSSNVCNFKCRTCEPFFSTGIAAEVRASPALMSFHAVPQTKTATTDNKDWVIANLAQFRKLMFTGGEPTMLPDVREIIQQVRDRGLATELLIITNGSFRDPWWIEQAKIMPNLNFTVSIDAVGNEAELIRHGTDWFRVENNIRQLAEHASSLNFSTVISRMNLFQLGPLLNFVQEIQNTYRRPNGKTQFVEICKHPDYLAPDVWPMGLRAVAQDYLQKIIATCQDQQIKQTLENLLQSIITRDYDHALWQRGEQYNMELNRIRGENHTRLYQPRF